MPKVVKILKDACSEVVLLADGTTIHQPRDACDLKHKPNKDYLKDYVEVAEKSERTVWMKSPLFTGLKVGTDVPLDFTEPTETKTPDVPKSKETIAPKPKETVESLEKHLAELKKQRHDLDLAAKLSSDEPAAGSAAEPSEKPSEKPSTSEAPPPSKNDVKD